jgi:hypothetical protein
MYYCGIEIEEEGVMKERKARDRELYSCQYEYNRDWLWTAVIEDDDVGYPKVFSYIKEEDLTYLRRHGVRKENITGRMKEAVFDVEYKASMNIKEAFRKVEDVMMTKKETKGKRLTLKVSMDKLKPHEEYTLISLLNYLRESWLEGERGDVALTWAEFYLLKEGCFKKPPKNKKK